jgi:uncharacterized membrane-anchored protein
VKVLNRPIRKAATVKEAPLIKGKVRVGASTKQLLRNLPPKQIVVLRHQDLDEVIVQSLIEHKVRGIINCAPVMSGTYPTNGPLMLLQQGIPIWAAPEAAFDWFQDGSFVRGYENSLKLEDGTLPASLFTKEEWLKQHQKAQRHLQTMLRDFIENTLNYARQETQFVLDPFPAVSIQTNFHGKHVLVVTRGSGYKQDLEALKMYIRDYRPVLVAVDGGADAMLEFGYRPDLIVGDMDSVSDAALTCGAELLVHAYLDGSAPGMSRLEAMGLCATAVPCMGTSEDLAMLLAYEKQCELIVMLGAHTHMVDFLEKGRKGMGSTLLVRMKIGGKLIDAKGVSRLYRKPVRWARETAITLFMAVLLIILSLLQLQWGMKRMMQAMWNIVSLGVLE